MKKKEVIYNKLQLKGSASKPSITRGCSNYVGRRGEGGGVNGHVISTATI